uniref:Uncharacterized protein n=1 Tax=Arundo donax TaxID=35708 RepID=A0A0A9HR24_ARUDO
MGTGNNYIQYFDATRLLMFYFHQHHCYDSLNHYTMLMPSPALISSIMVIKMHVVDSVYSVNSGSSQHWLSQC